MRNEELNIIALLNSILDNDYPTNKIEIIIVNDHSTDRSQELVEEWKNLNSDIKLSLVLAVGLGKKNAVVEGLKVCGNEIILQTDADCVVPKDWISKLVAPFFNEKVKLVAGPVALTGNGLLQKLQALEFSSLIASSIGLSNMNWHIMANAANLAYRKTARENLTFDENSESGDDVFFIQKLAAEESDSIVYLSESVVKTSAKATLKGFVQQRLRWASKTKEYPNPKGIWVALLILFVNIFTLLAFIGLFFSSFYALMFLIVRFLADGILLNNYYRNVLKERLPIGLFLFQSFLNPFYILSIGISSQFIKIMWKDREL